VPLPRFSGTHLSCSRPAGPSPAPGAFTVVRSSQKSVPRLPVL